LLFVFALLNVALSSTAFSRSLGIGLRGRTGPQGITGATGARGDSGPPATTEIFLYRAEQQQFITDAFYTVNFTIGQINNTNFDGSAYTVPVDGIYQFTTLITIKLIVPSLSDNDVEISYLVNGVQEFLFLSNYYTDTGTIFNPIYMIWSTQLSTGDVVTVNLFSFGVTNLLSEVDFTTSFFSGYLIS
jgi:hypothetical protein